MTEHPPKIDNAPGLTWKRIKAGWLALWRARTDLVKRGYTIKNVRLIILPGEPTPDEAVWIAEYCTSLQGEMLLWGRDGLELDGMAFDGSLRDLIRCYRTDPDSRYRKLRPCTREGYDSHCNALVAEHGAMLIADIKGRMLRRWDEDWSADGSGSRSHSRAMILRILATFGSTILDDEDCRKFKALLHDMTFATPKARVSHLTSEQVVAIRKRAHAIGRPSLALAQALQCDLVWRQKDVIGEWVALSEKEPSEIHDANEKWIRGLRWSEIDADLIVRHVTSKRQKEYEGDLKLCPMVLEELNLIYGTTDRAALPANGPVIIQERTGLPYRAHTFRRTWRSVATDVGVPANVWNMDTRAGSITEATDAGAALENVRHLATHSNISMTQRYSRGARQKIDSVMVSRNEFRNKSATKGRLDE